MEAITEKAPPTGKVIVRSHPPGTIDAYRELEKKGKLAEAETLIKAGKIEVEQKNLIVTSLNYGLTFSSSSLSADTPAALHFLSESPGVSSGPETPLLLRLI
jgi:hypothetical protein